MARSLYRTRLFSSAEGMVDWRVRTCEFQNVLADRQVQRDEWLSSDIRYDRDVRKCVWRSFGVKQVQGDRRRRGNKGEELGGE